MFLAKGWSPLILNQENKGGVNESPDQHVVLVHPVREVSLAEISKPESVICVPKSVDAVPFADDGLPKAFEEEERRGWIRDLEEDVCELCSQSLLDEWLVGHPVTFFRGPISSCEGDQVTISG